MLYVSENNKWKNKYNFAGYSTAKHIVMTVIRGTQQTVSVNIAYDFRIKVS